MLMPTPSNLPSSAMNRCQGEPSPKIEGTRWWSAVMYSACLPTAHTECVGCRLRRTPGKDRNALGSAPRFDPCTAGSKM